MSDAKKILNVNIGILGHVDSGKTSLAKAISTHASTAAFDKHPQSQQRGITLDLGFSAFYNTAPERFAKKGYTKNFKFFYKL
jgi:selenocysteine-specific elongation factor